METRFSAEGINLCFLASLLDRQYSINFRCWFTKVLVSYSMTRTANPLKRPGVPYLPSSYPPPLLPHVPTARPSVRGGQLEPSRYLE